jgi:hypothetical protein
MHCEYDDIRSKITEPPKWFDENAVPRYCDFEPGQLADIYAFECCLLRIECQNCGQEFDVAMSESSMDRMRHKMMFGTYEPSLSDLVRRGDVHYGDPPNARCCQARAAVLASAVASVDYRDDAVLAAARAPGAWMGARCDAGSRHQVRLGRRGADAMSANQWRPPTPTCQAAVRGLVGQGPGESLAGASVNGRCSWRKPAESQLDAEPGGATR